MVERPTIVVAYKKRWGNKTWLKVFNDLLCPDKIISSRSKLLPEGSQIVDLGVGKSFIKDNPKGTYILGVSKHAFTIKDGQLIDNKGEEFRPTRKVESAFKITPEVTNVQLSLFNA